MSELERRQTEARIRELTDINADLLGALDKVTMRLEHLLKREGITAPADVRMARAAIAKARQYGCAPG